MENEDYMDKVKNQIELDKLLHSVKPENRKQVELLYQKKKEILQKNSFFADWQLKRISKKINQFKNNKDVS